MSKINFNKFLKMLVIVLLITSVSPVFAHQGPSAFTLEFSGKARFRYTFKGTMQLVRRGNLLKYRFDTETDITALGSSKSRQCSVIRVRSYGRLQPVAHVSQSISKKRTKTSRLKLLPKKRLVIAWVNGKRETHRYKPPVLDSLSMQLKLFTDLLHRPKDRYTYTVLKRNGTAVRRTVRVVKKDVRVKTAGTRFTTWEVHFIRKKGVLKLWLAPKLNFLPVKIAIERKGFPITVSATLTRISPDQNSIKQLSPHAPKDRAHRVPPLRTKTKLSCKR